MYYKEPTGRSRHWETALRLTRKHPASDQYTHQCVKVAQMAVDGLPVDAICGHLFRIKEIRVGSGSYSTSLIVKHNSTAHHETTPGAAAAAVEINRCGFGGLEVTINYEILSEIRNECIGAENEGTNLSLCAVQFPFPTVVVCRVPLLPGISESPALSPRRELGSQLAS